MSNAKDRSNRQVRWLGLIVFMALFGALPGQSQKPEVPGNPSPAAAQLPEAPQPVQKTAEVNPAAPGPTEVAEANGAQSQSASPAGASQSSSSAPQSNGQKPLGTAAAPPQSSVGFTASRPAGAVIAPAKQRRARAIMIRMALIVGAGVALGTVLALSRATPSQPPK